MMRFNLIAVCLMLVLLVCGESAFAPSSREENTFLRCLFTRGEEECLKIKRSRRLKRAKYCKSKVSGSVDKDDGNLDSAEEYLCALNVYQNTARARKDAVNAILSGGSCGRVFSSVAATWEKFLAERGGDIIRIHPPDWQRLDSSTAAIGFNAANFAERHAADRLEAVDLIISRSKEADVEVYGKYLLRVAIQKETGEKVVVHESLQATCTSERKRFFVAGMNSVGLNAMANWYMNQNNSIRFVVDLSPQMQVIKGSGVGANYVESNFDVGLRVSGIALHFSGQDNRAVPLPNGMIYPRGGHPRKLRPSRGSRQKRGLRVRSTATCHRERYLMNYRNNIHVIRPVEFDLGECVGSCEQALTTSPDFGLNATNHALSMLWEIFKRPVLPNPEPTVCCVPVSYRKFYYVTFDDRGILMSTYTDNMVTEYCGCR